MLELSIGQVPLAERLLQAIRDDSLHEDIGPLIVFARTFGHEAHDLVEFLAELHFEMYPSVVASFNGALEYNGSQAKVREGDLACLKKTIKIYRQFVQANL